MANIEDEILMYINNELKDIQNTINEELYYENKSLNSRKEIDEIKKYIEEFLSQRTPNRVIVLPGLQGVGKSIMLFQLYDYLLKEKNISPNNILYLPCDDLFKTLNCDIKKNN